MNLRFFKKNLENIIGLLSFFLITIRRNTTLTFSKLLIITLSIFYGFSHFSLAQNPPPGIDRSEGLRLKAKLEYEKKTRSKNEKIPVQQSPVQQLEPAQNTPNSGLSRGHSGKTVTCKNGNETRDLVLENKGAGCELFYIKFGQSKSQARQNSGTSVCESVFEKMKATLEKTGFICESKKD